MMTDPKISAQDDHTVRFGGSTVMRARVDRDDGVVTLSLVGEFDLAVADSFTTVLTEIEATHPHAIVIDLTGLSFMDSSGIKALVYADERATGCHAFAVVNGSGPAHRVLALVGLHETLLIVDHAWELREHLAVDARPVGE